MNSTSSSSVLVLSFLIVIAAAGLVIISFLTRSESIQLASQASEQEETCALRANVYINELTEDGSEIPLVFSTSGTNPLLWGFADTINLPPYTESIIPFNAPDRASYSIDNTVSSFSISPAVHQVYPSDQTISVTTMIDDVNYDIIRRDIKTCSASGNDIWLCGRQSADTDLHTITDIQLRCDMDLAFGWVVQRRNEPATPIAQLSDTNPIQFLTSDLNGDGVVSAIDLTIVIDSYGKTDPIADVNKDGKINVIDYQLIADSIRHQSQFDNALGKDL